MMALQALSTAETKAAGSGDLRGAFDFSEVETVLDALDKDRRVVGGVHEDHFQPGVSVGSSRSERSRSLVRCSPGRRRRVIENPGMFRLVFIEVGDQLAGYYQRLQRTMKVPEMRR